MTTAVERRLDRFRKCYEAWPTRQLVLTEGLAYKPLTCWSCGERSLHPVLPMRCPNCREAVRLLFAEQNAASNAEPQVHSFKRHIKASRTGS
jgi:hypothetical protein